MWTIPLLLLQGGSVHVRVHGQCLRAVSKLHAKPTNHPSSSFSTIGKLSPVGMNVSRSDGSTTDRDPVLECFEIESRNLGDIPFVIFLLLLLSRMKTICLDDLYWKEYLRDTRDSKYKITGEFLRRLEENIPIYWKWLREQFCHTPAISHVRNNLRSLWYSPPFHINLSMPQDSPLLTDQFDMILERGEDIYKTVFLQHSWLTFQSFKNNCTSSVSFNIFHERIVNILILYRISVCMDGRSISFEFLKQFS